MPEVDKNVSGEAQLSGMIVQIRSAERSLNLREFCKVRKGERNEKIKGTKRICGQEIKQHCR